MAAPENDRSVGILKIMFLLHLFCSSWGMSSVIPVVHPDSYFYYNFIFMAALIWAIVQKTGVDSTAMGILITIACIALDCVTLSMYWLGSKTTLVSFGFAIANAALRPLTGIMLYQLFKARDTEGVGFSGIFADVFGPAGDGQSGGSRQGYQNPNDNAPVANAPQEQQQGSPSGAAGYQAV